MNYRAIAFYLPQFYPIPENDVWWEPGFTEWTNVTRAKPLFRGHYQPNLPSDLGLYDLRVPEVREAQAELARSHGIEGFCYWHYWFGNGRRILERVFSEVLETGKPDFPFCLGWANDSWSGVWHGAPDRILIEQQYPGIPDYEAHFKSVLPAFRDRRYICVDGKPLFLVYKPWLIPNVAEFSALWKGMARDSGLPGLHLVGIARYADPLQEGFDASVSSAPDVQIDRMPRGLMRRIGDRISRQILRKQSLDILCRDLFGIPRTREYDDFANSCLTEPIPDYEYPVVVPNWDNTPRSGTNGIVLNDGSPEAFAALLRRACRLVKGRDPQKRLVFIKSWNEWAEGNYLEPDLRFGSRFLLSMKEVFESEHEEKQQPESKRENAIFAAAAADN
jgi:glycosyl transferase family WbsX